MKAENNFSELRHVQSPSELKHHLMSTEKRQDVTSSVAISCAMQALQSRIRQLESEKSSLIADHKSQSFNHSKASSYINSLEHKIEEKTTQLVSSQSNSQHFEDLYNNLQQENHLTSESLRLEEQHFRSQIEELKFTIEELSNALTVKEEEKAED